MNASPAESTAARPAADNGAASPKPLYKDTVETTIGSDLTISGQGIEVVSQGTLRIDGEINGEVRSRNLVIGEHGRINGAVAAENIEIYGHVSGMVRGVNVSLRNTAHVEGDILHHSLALEQGAHFDGRSVRPPNRDELVPELAKPQRGAGAAA